MKRALVVVMLLLVSVPAAAVVFGTAVLDSWAVRGRLQAVVLRATGHELRIDGPIRIAWAWSPTVEVQAVTLLNPPGYMQPDFASVQRLAVRVALGPLLRGRVEVATLMLEGAEVLLERNPAGRGNWLPPAGGARAAGNEQAPSPGGRATLVRQVTVENARVAMLGGPVLTIETLSLVPAGGPVAGQVIVNGTQFAVSGSMGPAAVDLAGSGGGVAVSAKGRDGAWTLDGTAADLAAAGPLLGRELPPLRDVAVHVEAGPAGLGAMHLTSTGGSLGMFAPGVQLRRLEMTAAGADQPLTMVAEGAFRALPMAVTINVASLSALTGPGPVPFQMLVVADGGSLGGQGQVADRSWRGLEMTVSGHAPDLGRTGELAGVALPSLRDAVLEARVLPAAGGNGLLVRGFRLSMGQGDLAGDLAVGVTPRPSLRGSLVSQRLDLDGLTPPVSHPQAATPNVGPAAPSPEPGLPFARLRLVDGDMKLNIGQMTAGGVSYRAVEARLLLQDGRLKADPLQAVGPGGAMQGQVLADAAAVPPTVAVALRAPGLDAADVGAGLGWPGALTGAMDVDVQLRGTGADVPALMASAEGHVGLALIDGDVANEALAALFGTALRAAHVPVDAAGRSRVRCLAVRVNVGGGQARVPAMAVDSVRVRLDGDGVVDMVAGTMDLHVRPTIKVGGTSVAIPVRLVGPLLRPAATVERGAGGRFGLSIGGPAAGDVCMAALVAARDGRDGAMPR